MTMASFSLRAHQNRSVGRSGLRAPQHAVHHRVLLGIARCIARHGAPIVGRQPVGGRCGERVGLIRERKVRGKGAGHDDHRPGAVPVGDAAVPGVVEEDVEIARLAIGAGMSLGVTAMEQAIERD